VSLGLDPDNEQQQHGYAHTMVEIQVDGKSDQFNDWVLLNACMVHIDLAKAFALYIHAPESDTKATSQQSEKCSDMVPNGWSKVAIPLHGCCSTSRESLST
jgi:hypothetical protein